MALPQQKLVFNGAEMMNLQRLSSVGVGDGDLVRMLMFLGTSFSS